MSYLSLACRSLLRFLIPCCKQKAAFDHRVLSSVCFFATDIHSTSLGRGKNDDTLERVRNGDLNGKGELVMIFGKQVRLYCILIAISRTRCLLSATQDTHVSRGGRDLIRKTLEDANITASVRIFLVSTSTLTSPLPSSWRSRPSMRLSVTSILKAGGMPH